jgi:hypothetical protein
MHHSMKMTKDDAKALAKKGIEVSKNTVFR